MVTFWMPEPLRQVWRTIVSPVALRVTVWM